MIIISDTQSQSQAISEWIADALRYNRLVLAMARGQYVAEAEEDAQSLYDRLMQEDHETALAELRKLYLSSSGLTVRWSEPRQIPEGPHKGKWYIACPMKDGQIREEWVYQTDPLTGNIRNRSVWEGSEILERKSEWFNKAEDEI